MLLTAERAREMTNASPVVTRTVRKLVNDIMRQVKRAAKRGDDRIIVFYKRWDGKIAEKICLELRTLGYNAAPNMLHTGIVVDWRQADDTK